MNSRERVSLAINHKRSDKVPVSLGAHICDSFTIQSKNNYERYMNLNVTPYFMT